MDVDEARRLHQAWYDYCDGTNHDAGEEQAFNWLLAERQAVLDTIEGLRVVDFTADAKLVNSTLDAVLAAVRALGVTEE